MKLHKTGYLKIPQATSKGYIECPAGAVFDWTYPDSKMRRGRVQRGGASLSYSNCQLWYATTL